MPISPVNGRRQPNVGVNTGLGPRKSISFVGPGKGALMKGGYAGANQSRMAMSKNMMILPEAKQMEKMTISSAKTVTQVTDIHGVDVTPKPLYRPDPYSGTGKPNKLLTSQDGSHTSDFIASYSLYQNTINPSMLGQFTRSVLGSSTVSKSSVSTSESMAEDLEEPSFKRERLSSFTDLRVMRTAPGKIITKEDLEKTVEIILTETETMNFLNLPTVMFSVESEEAEKVSQRNKNYETLCRNRLGNDLYVERMMQTINGAPKNKDVQCDKILKEDKVSEGSSLMDIENVILAKVRDEEEDNSDAVFKSDKFQQDLFFMERVIMENIFQPKLAAYRQLPILKEPEPEEPGDFLVDGKLEVVEEEAKKEEEEDLEISSEQSTIPANLERLWSFSCDLTKGLNVSSLAWNKANPDLLAVGYGHFGFKEQKRGLACCWSIKNPM